MELNKIQCGDCLELLRKMPDESINCCVTSPPYYALRDYGVPGQIGLEATPKEYISKMVQVFHEVLRVLKSDGTLWLNLGDCYCGSGSGQIDTGKRSYDGDDYGHKGQRTKVEGLKPKNLLLIPHRVAIALQDDGWYLRQDNVWFKPNAMPESVTDRTSRAHEYVFMLTKNEQYYYDAESIKEPCVTEEERPFGIIRDRLFDYDSKEAIIRGRKHDDPMMGGGGSGLRKIHDKQSKAGRRTYTGFNKRWDEKPTQMKNKRSVWTINTHPYLEAHFATFPPDLVETCIKPGCPVGGIVLDPFMGSGTTGEVALKLNRQFIGLELNPEYVKLANKRIFSGSATLDSFGEKKAAVEG